MKDSLKYAFIMEELGITCYFIHIKTSKPNQKIMYNWVIELRQKIQKMITAHPRSLVYGFMHNAGKED